MDYQHLGDGAGDLGTASMVFTTNRHWGERSEGRYRVGEYRDFIDYDGDGNFLELLNRVVTEKNEEFGREAVFDTWRLVFENYGDNEIDILSYEVAFHGANVEGTGRIQGAIGVDDNGDGVFSDILDLSNPADTHEDNFTRYVTSAAFSVNHAADRFLNPHQESWAAGVIVYADLDHNGMRDPTDPHFQVGADGSYYFDLLAGGTYDLRIDPSSLEYAGLETVANLNLVNAGPFATVTVDSAGQRVLNQSFVDNDGVSFNVKGDESVNFLFDQPPQAPDTFEISGVIFADLDSNGVQDGADFGIENADIYVDINQNGVYTPGVDYLATTDADGNYKFESGVNGIPPTTETGYYNVVVLPGTTGPFGTAVNPDTGKYGIFFDFQIPDILGDPGMKIENLDFAFGPGAGAGGGSGVGAITGTVFDDVDADGIRDAGEQGLQNVANVYLDLDGDNVRGIDDPVVSPGSNGAYAFGALTPGTYAVRIEFSTTQYDQTTPSGALNPDGSRINEDAWEYEITVAADSIYVDQDFGLNNKAILDYGDLPDIYGTTAASGGATHIVFGDLYLGDTPTDAEIDAPIQLDGSGDDVNGNADEDGITFSTLENGSVASTNVIITVDANVGGGYLQGWMDFNEDGVFQASERVFDDELLPAGISTFDIPVPANLTGGGGTVYARFRYGEEGIDSPVGAAIKGEVEDYALPVVSNAIDPGPQAENGPDFDEDGDIDGFDFLAWQRGFGSMGAIGAGDGDSDNDNDVDSDDLVDWEAGFGTVESPPAPVIVETADYDEDGDTDGADFLAWQQGFGAASPAVVLADGDGDSSDTVDTTDLAIWEASFGSTPSEPAAATAPEEESSEDNADQFALAEASIAQPKAPRLNVEADTSGATSGQVDFAPAATKPQASTPAVRLEANELPGTLDAASVASAMRSLREAGLAARDRLSGVLFETQSSETAYDQSIDLEDLSYAIRDRVVDNLFAIRERTLESRFDQLYQQDVDESDAFAAALDEEIDWRFS